MKPYPSRNGVPVPTNELGLALSRLNPDIEKNWNQHHLYYEKRTYLGNGLFRALRNLQRAQEPMLKDTHNIGKNTLHSLYGPPKQPTPRQAIEQIDEAYNNNEKLSIWSKSLGKYALREITPEYYEKLNRYYERMKG